MAKHYHWSKFVNINNTGFGPNSAVEGGRLTNKDGTTNLKKIGIPIWNRTSLYHTMLRMKRSHFLLMVLLFYTTVNIIFACVYYFVGVEQLTGIDGIQDPFHRFMEAFFFSSQTLTTVGFGHVAPVGMAANSVASIESLIGILIFALVTGLMYGRFSRPRAYVVFSENMLVSPYKEGRGLMFRIATYKNNHLTDVEALVNVAIHEIQEDGNRITKFYQLPLEFGRINSLALSWTLVHEMNDSSPLYGFTEKDFIDSKVEVIVSIKAFDDHFSNTVQQRTSYTADELVYGAKFISMFHKAPSGTHTILELDKINAHKKVILPGMEENYSNTSTVTANT